MGLVERPGSIESGDVPRYSYIRRNAPVRELSIFIDESGDFGPYKYFRCPKCRVLMRTARGGGEKEMYRPKCHTSFKVKS